MDVLLVGDCLCDGVDGGRVDFVGQVEQEVEVAVLQPAWLNVLDSLHVLLEVFLGRLVPDHGREVGLLDHCEFVVFGAAVRDLHQQKLRLELGDCLSAGNEGGEGIGGSALLQIYFSFTRTCIFLLELDYTNRSERSRAWPWSLIM